MHHELAPETLVCDLARLAQYPLHPLELFGRGPGGGERRDVGLDHAARLEPSKHLIDRVGADDDALARHDLEKAVSHQPVHGLMHRHAAHTDHRAQALLVHELARSQVERQDARLDRLVGALREPSTARAIVVYHVIF